ncbi:hypothetical protein [Patulibacter minatonensis]|uniref:hypothetical protein n=1 Tax=Patulibacter minatonensis TaxID=298163 RepID=UPI0004B14EB5|nr:hypothetical protein [Patulibacter minatonensis]
MSGAPGTAGDELERARESSTVGGRPVAELVRSGHLPPDPYGFRELVWADYEAHYHYKEEPAERRRLLFLPRLLTNSSLHATLLIRLVQKAPGATTWLWRRLLLALHGCDVGRQTVIGPGLQMTHPTGIVVGVNTSIGAGVTLMQGVTVSPVTTNWRVGGEMGVLHIGDGVTVFANAGVFGPITVGDDAIVGSLALVSRDVPSRWIATRDRMRPARQDELAGVR